MEIKRDKNGHLLKYQYPDGKHPQNPLYYIIKDWADHICADCAEEDLMAGTEEKDMTCEVNRNDKNMTCDFCEERIENQDEIDYEIDKEIYYNEHPPRWEKDCEEDEVYVDEIPCYDND